MSLIPAEVKDARTALSNWLVSKTNPAYGFNVSGTTTAAVVMQGQVSVYAKIDSLFKIGLEHPDCIANPPIATALQTLITDALTNDAELNKLDGIASAAAAGTTALNFADKYRWLIGNAFVNAGFNEPKFS